MEAIRKAAVIGAGVMGAGIAAQFANAGVPVLLLDIVPAGTANRNVLAESAISNMLKTDPAAFMSARAARSVTAGNVEDTLAQIADCDWIIEAVTERLDVKQALYRRIDTLRRPGSAVSSNTSTIPLHMLTRGLSGGFARDFLITHFFNPPRYMRLLEIVTGINTDPQLAQSVVSNVLSLFMESSAGDSRTDIDSAQRFLQTEIDRLETQLREAERKKS